MKRKFLFLLPAALFAVLLVAFAMGLNHDPQLLPSALINRPAPDFSLPGLYDPAHGLARKDLGGGVTLVNFFASWCLPCREEQAALMALAHRPGVTLDGIAYKDKRCGLHGAFSPISAIHTIASRLIATVPRRSILASTGCRKPMSSTAPGISAIARSVR